MVVTSGWPNFKLAPALELTTIDHALVFLLPHDEDWKTNKGNKCTPNADHCKHPIVDLTVIWNIFNCNYSTWRHFPKNQSQIWQLWWSVFLPKCMKEYFKHLQQKGNFWHYITFWEKVSNLDGSKIDTLVGNMNW